MPSSVTAATEESRRVWGATVAVVARLGLAVVWAWAAIAKLGDADGAVRAVRAYEILPEALVKPFAWGLPFVELALALLLVLGIGTRVAGWISAVILTVFMAGIISVWARGIQIDCGCFGGGGAADVNGWTYAARVAPRRVLPAPRARRRARAAEPAAVSTTCSRTPPPREEIS